MLNRSARCPWTPAAHKKPLHEKIGWLRRLPGAVRGGLFNFVEKLGSTDDAKAIQVSSLGSFQNFRGLQALVEVLRTEQDVALRSRAHESLQVATGKELPPDATVWADFLYKAGGQDSAVAREPSFKDKVPRLTGFSTRRD
jgi:hypothetical protein